MQQCLKMYNFTQNQNSQTKTIVICQRKAQNRKKKNPK